MSRAWLALLGLVAGCQGCVNGQPTPAATAGENLGICVLTQYATYATCRPAAHNPVGCVADIAKACGSDAVTVGNVLAAHTHAMVADGLVPPPTGDQ